MENKLDKKCYFHKEQTSNFFCFDDKKFLCNSCFKTHKNHNIEVISEIIKYEKIYKNIIKKKSVTESLTEIKKLLNEIIKDIEDKLNTINSILSSLKNSSLSPVNNSILNLNYKKYEKIEDIFKIFISMNTIYNKISALKNYKINNEYINFREINKEVNIIENSKVSIDLNIMLGKSFGIYSLFEGSNNHFAIFDLQKKFYLKDVLISVKQDNECVLKNFKISIKNEYGIWEEVNTFCCKDNHYKDEIQRFPIEKETQFVKINFIDAWSNHGGNHILIKKLSFLVADII